MGASVCEETDRAEHSACMQQQGPAGRERARGGSGLCMAMNELGLARSQHHTSFSLADTRLAWLLLPAVVVTAIVGVIVIVIVTITRYRGRSDGR